MAEELVYLDDVLRESQTIEEALGITPSEMKRLNLVVNDYRIISKKPAQVLHHIATDPELTDLQKVYATFKFVEWLNNARTFRGRWRNAKAEAMRQVEARRG